MKLTGEELQKAFKKYYKEKGENASHIFVYSKSQEKRYKELYFLQEYNNTTTINGHVYTEMRNRDSENLNFNDIDVVFVGVGTYNDVKHLQK